MSRNLRARINALTQTDRIRIAGGVIAVAACCVVMQPAHAQLEFLSIAPARYSAEAFHDGDEGLTTVLVGFDRAIPVVNLLPQVSADSYFEFLRIKAGLRTSSEQTNFRLHATGASFEIQKRPWSASFGLIDVNAGSSANVSADWLALGFGPGLDFDAYPIRFVLKGLVNGSVNSTRFGEVVFPELDEAAGDLRTTVTYGAVGAAGIVYDRVVSLLVRYGLVRYAIDPDIERVDLKGTVTVHLSRKWELLGSIDRTEAVIDEAEDTALRLGFGVRFTPAESY